MCLRIPGPNTVVQTKAQGEMLDHHVLTGSKNSGCRLCSDGKGNVCCHLLSFAVRPEKLETWLCREAREQKAVSVSYHYSDRTMTF